MSFVMDVIGPLLIVLLTIVSGSEVLFRIQLLTFSSAFSASKDGTMSVWKLLCIDQISRRSI